MKLNYFLILFIIFAFFSSCLKNEQEVNLPFEGQLIFIEDLDGSDGILAGSFGDIVLLDGNQNLRKVITDDSYFNDYPTWANNGNTVWFESKRSENIETSGLSADSYLHRVDIKSGKIRKVNSLPKFPTDTPSRTSKPSVSTSGNKIVFQTPLEKLIYADLKAEKSKELNLGFKTYERFSWSPDEDKIIFSGSHNDIVYGIGLYYLKSDSLKMVSENLTNNPQSGKEALTCKVGNWASNGDFFIYTCNKLGDKKSKVYRYDLRQEEASVIYQTENHIVYSPQISKDKTKIFYIATGGNLEWHDIYMYDLEKENRSQLTSNKNHKSHLSYRPSSQ